MKSKLFIALSAIFSISAQADIFISEYIEGGSYNKAIELYNPKSEAINLAGYQLKLYQNGANSASYTINLSGEVSSKDVFVIAHENFADISLVDFPVANLLHNGDDAVVLEHNNQVIDVIGMIGSDPGTQWGVGLKSTKDNTLVRNANIIIGNSTFDAELEWQGFAKDTLSNLGFHYSADSGSENNTDPDNTEPDNEGELLSQCGQLFTPIHIVQGASENTPIEGESVWIEGIVTADYQHTGYKGFYLQSADNEVDALITTSEAVFVYHSSTDVAVGNRIRLKANVAEYYGLTQLSTVTDLSLCQQSVALPTPHEIALPLTAQVKDLEWLEGMRITFPQTLYVTDTYNYGRYGQLGLASERLFNPTQVTSPGVEAQAVLASNQQKKIILDDGDTVQNPDLLPFPAPGLSAANPIRSGDSINNLTAVLSYSFGQYQLLPTQGLSFINSNQRTNEVELNTLGNLRIASFNVLNYFNGDGVGGGFPTARGAETQNDFIRQRSKIISAIISLKADVIGLMEIENDGYGEYSAIADLTRGLNEELGENLYQFVIPPIATMGTDAIAVGLLYRKDKVIPTNPAKVLDSQNSMKSSNGQPLFLDSKNRPMLTQAFSYADNNEQFVVAVNHLKSKGSHCDSLGDHDMQDGQGNCNVTRTLAAQAIAHFLLAEYGDSPTLVIGDLNAYAKEDPITTLSDAGYKNLFASLNKEEVYSYIFKGELGQLDHAMANSTLLTKVVDVNTWAINADEVRSLDYTTNYKNLDQQTMFYAPDAYRSSDHDPVVVEINLMPAQLFGDLDRDQDVDKNDVSLFLAKINSQNINDLAYDFDGNKQVNRRDIRGFMQLCTRSRCASE